MALLSSTPWRVRQSGTLIAAPPDSGRMDSRTDRRSVWNACVALYHADPDGRNGRRAAGNRRLSVVAAPSPTRSRDATRGAMKAIVRTAQPDARNWATAQARGSPRWSELRAQSGRAACGEGAVGGSAGESAGTVPMGQSRDSWTGGWHAWFPAWLSDKPATPSTSCAFATRS